ncbi:hypothetical protein SAMN04488104_102057 [Algoriphagus faecimaris]|uniref:Uncharacterized protein n=1 Tax=Algoriphagus faecimaris TaxID=686796 RepID=A0A1G6T437_9BACT|nr:hypothetical protein [Algoriphagus faecimaris]SDD23779.1 hypothetical protein SAMN04488104_102057 [Algoriphagus faecimaris]
MKRIKPELIAAIERTAQKLKEGAAYQWGHMGACNCGNLAQELTFLSKAEIHRYAMERSGDWNDQILEFCPTSGYPIDLIIDKMLDYGLTLEDLGHLERLSSPIVLQALPIETRNRLNQNRKEDVILYLQVWAKVLRDQWASQQEMEDLKSPEKKLDPIVLS